MNIDFYEIFELMYTLEPTIVGSSIYEWNVNIKT